VDVVLHQAALGSVPRSIEDPIGANESNVTDFLNMLVAAHGSGVSRFVYAGSSAIYGDHPALPKVEAQIGRPLSPYAVTKRVTTVDDPAAVNEVYNVALNERISLNELFAILRSMLEQRYPHLRSLRPIYREFRHGDARASQADIDNARRLLGYRPLWDVRQGLARSIDWYVAKLAPPRSMDGAVPERKAARNGS